MKKYLTYEQVIDLIRSLSRSQGLYGRLLNNIMESEEVQEEFKKVVEEQKFETELDFILWYEC